MPPRGRPPKPTALKILQGNPGKRKLNPDEPKPSAPRKKRPPEHLHRYAKELWIQYVPELERLGLLSLLDTGLLEMGCSAYAEWRLAHEALEEHGRIQEIIREDGSTYRQQSPEVSMAKQAYEQYRGFCNEFGLSPASRTRINGPSSGDLNAKEEERFFG